MAYRYYEKEQYGGKWKPAYSNDDFIKAVSKIEHATPRRICEMIGCSMALAQMRLKKLRIADLIDGELVGHNWIYKKKELKG